jgi:hypothetical protein
VPVVLAEDDRFQFLFNENITIATTSKPTM